MALLALYIIFALTTAIVAVYELLMPLKYMVEKGKVIENWYTVLVTFFIISLLIAPVMLLPTIIPDMGNRFRESLLKELQVDEA